MDPPIGYPVQFRVTGPEIDTVRSLSEQVAAIMRADSRTSNVQFDWDEPAERMVHFEIDQTKARAPERLVNEDSGFFKCRWSGYDFDAVPRARSSSLKWTCAHPRSGAHRSGTD